MLNTKEMNLVPQKSNGVAPVNDSLSLAAKDKLAGSLNSEPQNETQKIVIDVAKIWAWMKPSYKKSALIIVGMNAGIKNGNPVSYPNANVYMSTKWESIPVEWQDRLKRFFVQ